MTTLGHYPEQAPRAVGRDAVLVHWGNFERRTIVTRIGEPLVLNFLRETPSVCAERVIIPAFGIDVRLPVGQEVSIELAPERPGEYPFLCEFGTLRGRLIVR